MTLASISRTIIKLKEHTYNCRAPQSCYHGVNGGKILSRECSLIGNNNFTRVGKKRDGTSKSDGAVCVLLVTEKCMLCGSLTTGTGSIIFNVHNSSCHNKNLTKDMN